MSARALVSLVVAVGALVGASVGLAFTDARDDAFQVGYIVLIGLSLVGVASAIAKAQQVRRDERRHLAAARAEAEAALIRLAEFGRQAPDSAAAWRLVELTQLMAARSGERLHPEAAEALGYFVRDAYFENALNDRRAVEDALRLLTQQGRDDDARDLAARMAAIVSTDWRQWRRTE
jgi:hypothetical protein